MKKILLWFTAIAVIASLVPLSAGAVTKQFQVDTGGTLTTSLVAYYKMEDATDFWSTNNLSNVNSVSFVAGKVNNAGSFNGTSNYLQKSGVISTSTNNYSFFMWVYVPTTSEKGCFFHNGTDDLNGYSIGVGTGSGSGQDGVGNVLVGAAAGLLWHPYGINIGTGWHFVGVIRNAGVETGYVDGTAGPTTWSDAPAAPTGFVTVGADSSPARYWDGKVDEIGFWNKVLSSTEISNLYNAGAGQTMTSSGGTRRKVILVSFYALPKGCPSVV